MGNIYDNDKHSVITRKWFGLTKKWGGDAATGYTVKAGATGDPDADATVVAKYYPKGPIDVIKFGRMVLASIADSGSDVDVKVAHLVGRGASASLMASFNIIDTGTTDVPGQIASIEGSDTTDFLVRQLKAGEYLSIDTGTAQTDNGTTIAATLTGTVAYFIDTVPKFDSDKWDADTYKYQA